MMSFPVPSRCLIVMVRTRRSPSIGLGDRHEPEQVIVFTGIRTLGPRDLLQNLTFFARQWTKGILTPTAHTVNARSCYS